MLGNELACIERPSARRRSSLHRVLGSALLLGVAAGASPALASSTLVTAPDGTFQGKFDITGAMREFLGLRYAQPVTGNLRWKAPQPVTPSAVTQDATRFGNHCPQVFTPYGNATQTEDCLFLNVFAPNRRGDHDLRDDDAHPVMVWIHGGGSRSARATNMTRSSSCSAA